MRILIRRRSGYRNVRGGHVIELQKSIAGAISIPISVDGIFGRQTETALKIWQKSNGFEPSGMVDELTWIATTNRQPPSLFRRCLALTAAFEGHGYTIARGNWDNAYLTWGVVGFTLKHGNFGKVVKMVEKRHPGLIELSIGKSKSQELLSIVDSNASEKKIWGNVLSVPPKKYLIFPDWEDAFQELGNRPEVRRIQDEIAFDVYWGQAMKDLKRFGKPTEADAALFFDTAVQNGGIDAKKARLIAQYLEGIEAAKRDHRERLKLIARAVAKGSKQEFHDDVLSRKMCIANGNGVVHKSPYFVEDWAISVNEFF